MPWERSAILPTRNCPASPEGISLALWSKARWLARKFGERVALAGIDFDGTHAEFLAIPESAVVEIPHKLTLLQAGAQTLPFVTAYYGLVSRARIKAGETVLVLGALGQVGHAAMSICKWKKCRPIALVRENSLQKAKSLGWEATTSIPSDFDVVLNPLGGVYWDESMQKLKKFGRMVVISAGPEPKKPIALNLFPLFRANQEVLGINSVDLDFTQSGKLLSEMKPGFESGDLVPLGTDEVFPMEKATEAYRAILNHSDKRVTLKMDAINA